MASQSLEHEPEDSDHESEISRLLGFSLFILSFKSCSASNKAVAQHIPRRKLNESESKLDPCGLKDTASRRDRWYRFLSSNDLGSFVDPTFSPSQSA
jgi:hypothetical protein